MSNELRGLRRYKEAETYEAEQRALKEIADLNDLSIPQTRARLVNMGIYHNKQKKSSRILKSHYVDQLLEKLEDLNDTEVEYLERLTVSLLKKIIKATEK